MDEPPSDFVPRPAEGLLHRNVVAMHAARVRRSAHQPALRYKVGGVWRTMSWAQWEDAASALAASLLRLGIARGDRVAILSRTRREWVVADLAIAMAGAVSVPVYPSLAPDQAQAILADSGAVAVVLEEALGLEIIVQAHARGELSSLRTAIVIEDTGSSSPDGPLAVHAWDAAIATPPSPELAERLQALATAIGPDDEMTYVYTSGATGEPKGAVLCHRNLVYEAWAIKNVVPVGHMDEQLLVLPLAHIFARHLLWAAVEQGAVSAFAEREDRVMANFIEIAPTFVAAVPRMYERAYARIVHDASARGGVGRAVLERALEIGRRASQLRQRGEALPTSLALQLSLADRVLRRIRDQFGGRIRFFVSGGAPLSREVAELFHAVGLLILEGYGLSESTGATHVNRPDRFRFGTVGPALPGCETRLAEDGEVLLRGHNVMLRYHGRPQETAEVLDDQGWLHTGDIGELQDGFLRITDRKKDLLKTSAGKYVAPLMLEKRLRLHEGIAHATVCGDARPFVVALLSLDEEAMLARSDREGLGCHGYADLAVHPRIRQIVQAHVDEVNASLSRHERIRGLHVVPRPYAEETGELTPTRKVKRGVVLQRYAAAIEALYASDPAEASRSGVLGLGSPARG
ncbi:AMP-dependent synthetase/ligase [Paraliomyxa miuraensis]|uniref:AMP-dependent synthetase/ligase n=1 Tax=Paraliomyxa miuraensis TaxID=376150 RepID=UPI00224D9800|nr:long-chain fatty acid--CoA ligase [Paraliomyxa miuraensis]MCX4244548.1 long-chain fatty acid--CoA ligase [Paraliomyxa miuraensis]